MLYILTIDHFSNYDRENKKKNNYYLTFVESDIYITNQLEHNRSELK